MYLRLAGEEDKKMTDNWKGDADGILIFVSRYSTVRCSYTHSPPRVEDRFILCCRRDISRCVRTGPQAELPGHFGVLPRKHLSNPRQFEWLPARPHPSHTSQSVHPIFSAHLCHMGQLALVSQLGHRSHMRTFGHVTAAMGTSVHEGHPDTIQPTQTSTDPGVLCGGRRQTSPSLGSRSVACVVTPLSFPVLLGPRCVPSQYQPYGFQGDHIVGWVLYGHVHVFHIHADISAGQPILYPTFFISMVSSH